MESEKNKDKIVIIFSDGQPTECTDLELTKQVENMEKNGIVGIIQIIILDMDI